MLVRPSFVLSGAAMNVAANARQLESFLQEAADVAEVWTIERDCVCSWERERERGVDVFCLWCVCGWLQEREKGKRESAAPAGTWLLAVCEKG